MPRAGAHDDKSKDRPFDSEDADGRWYELPHKSRRIANPRIRRLILARIDTALAARSPKTG